MKATEHQQHFSELIDQKLGELNLPEKPASLYEPVRYTLSLGGKRIRPYFTLSACGMCGGKVEEAVPAAMAIELLHNFTLLHDDIMDGADTRRGKPSVFRKWNSSTAILSGDAMYAKAFEQLKYYSHHDRYSKEDYSGIIEVFLDSALTVCEGQAYDLEFEERESVTIDEYIYMIKGKTAALISGALKLGARVAGASSRMLNELQTVGNHIGIAFQIQDDLLDVIGDPEKFGKQRGGDILEGKKTYLSILSLQRSDESRKKILKTIFSKQKPSERDVEKVISLYNELGIVRETTYTVQDHYQSAVKHLDYFEESTYKSKLKDFLDRLIYREF